jgi:excisionase family DNA binding protein
MSGAANAIVAPLLTLGEVATILRVNIRTVRRLIVAGHLIATRVGGQLRVMQPDLEAYLRRQRGQ